MFLSCGNDPSSVPDHTGGTSSSSALEPSSSVAVSGNLEVSFTPLSDGGPYAPKNVNAAWVTDANGDWVVNLVAHGKERARYLRQWRSAYTKSITIGVDGVAGATQSRFLSCSGAWAPPLGTAGQYTLHLEFTTRDGQGPYETLDFELDGSAFDTTATFPFFQNVHLAFTP